MIPKSGYIGMQQKQDQRALTTFLFDYEKGDFVMEDGKLTHLKGEKALKGWIEKKLRTTIDEAPIYKGTEYGMSYRQLITGTPFQKDFIRSEMVRDIREGLMTHPQIRDIESLEIDFTEDRLEVSFTVNKSLEVSYEL